MKDTTLFAKFSLGFADNPKIIGLSDKAFRAYVEAIVYARQHLTDGFLDRRVVEKKWGTEVADELAGNDEVNPSWIAVEGGWLIHDFCAHQTTREEIHGMKESRRRAGIVSGEKRREQNANKIEHGVEQNANKIEPETETETETESSKDLFGEFWAIWPRHEARASALKAWVKALKKVDAETILEGARRLAESPHRPEKRFIPHGATWLNAERWTDPEPVAPATGLTAARRNLDTVAYFAALESQQAQIDAPRGSPPDGLG